MTHDEEESRAIAFLLLDDVCDLNRAQVLMGYDDDLSDSQKAELEHMAHRITNGEPVQYVIGRTEFCGLSINVAPGVLIPRPETEQLVSTINGVTQFRTSDTDKPAPKILDIGTGSGCIALALKNYNTSAEVHAIDVSEAALAQAMANARNLNLDVKFHQCDILNAEQTDELLSSLGSQFQVIVSNPPYVCESERADMEINVLDHEPSIALFVPDDDPLLFYRAIAQTARKHLAVDGVLAFEINQQFGYQVCSLLEELGYHTVELHKDCYLNDRIVTARR